MERDVFSNLSPMDHRYAVSNPELFAALGRYLSEEASVAYLLKVEAALVRALSNRGICPVEVATEVEAACAQVTAQEVYEEEFKTRHNIRAVVNCIRRRVSDEAKPFVHLSATSVDIIDTANSLRFREVTEAIVLPSLLEFERLLMEISLRERATLQIGRTHGQHAVPITFGFAMAEYVHRLGERILRLQEVTPRLHGKLAGAVGAYNASALFFDDPETFEEEVLGILGLPRALHSTQITPPEPMTDYFHALITVFGVLANLADDLRHLQRSEIGEVGEFFAAEQVGSSTMPHKRNPWNFENVKSVWKAMMPRMITLYSDQISEHQRDLTNSASSRWNPEIVAALVFTVERLQSVTARLGVDHQAMKRNFDQNKEMIIAEPLYILLASLGHPNAHEVVRRLTLMAGQTGQTLRALANTDAELQPYLERMTPRQRAVLENPEGYLGQASEKVDRVCAYWSEQLGLKARD